MMFSGGFFCYMLLKKKVRYDKIGMFFENNFFCINIFEKIFILRIERDIKKIQIIL